MGRPAPPATGTCSTSCSADVIRPLCPVLRTVGDAWRHQDGPSNRDRGDEARRLAGLRAILPGTARPPDQKRKHLQQTDGDPRAVPDLAGGPAGIAADA